MPQGYLGYDKIAHRVRKIFVGVNNKTREVMKAYVGVDGVAKQIFPPILDIPYVYGTYTFNQQEQVADLRDVDYQYIDISGEFEGTHARTYTITASIKSKYKPYVVWSDGTNEDKTITWSIDPCILPPVQQTTNLYYTGQSLSWAAADYNFENIIGSNWNSYISGSASDKTDVGTYFVRFSMIANQYDKYDYLFNGGFTSERSEWKISKATLHCVYTPSTSFTTGTDVLDYYFYNDDDVLIRRSGLSYSLIEYDPNNVITVEERPQSWDYVTYFVSGNATVAQGTASITVSVADTNNHYAVSATTSIRVYV